MTIDELINYYFEPVATFLASIIFYALPLMEGVELKLILVWMVAAAVFFTLYLGFINFRYFFYAWGMVFKEDHDEQDGAISSFQALMTSMAATIGLGNIGGVAIAISTGGPGAAFWMMIMGLFGMSLKFAEVYSGVKHRTHPDPDNRERISGGPMYYIKVAFEKYNLSSAGNVLAIAFGAFCALGALGAASLFQTNQSFQLLVDISGGEHSYFADKAWIFGVFMMLISAAVIVGGIKTIATVSGRIVPFMGFLYLFMGVFVLGYHLNNIPHAIVLIVTSAFSPNAAIGAILGTLLTGVQRASFSNESGLGSAAISQSAVKTSNPIEQGFVGMLGPFIDTVLVCTITALVIVVSGAYEFGQDQEGVALTSRAFETAHPSFTYALAAIVFMFAYSTIIGWYYIGAKGYSYIFGEKLWVRQIYQAIFLGFIIVGAAAELEFVVLFTDSMIFAMAIPNIIALYILAPEIKSDLAIFKNTRKTR